LCSNFFNYELVNFYLLISSNDIREVRLTDNTGRVVLRQSCNGNSQVNISVAGLSHGLYMIQVIDSKQTVQTGKLVIQ